MYAQIAEKCQSGRSVPGVGGWGVMGEGWGVGMEGWGVRGEGEGWECEG